MVGRYRVGVKCELMNVEQQYCKFRDLANCS
jgi:hypothetical protein